MSSRAEILRWEVGGGRDSLNQVTAKRIAHNQRQFFGNPKGKEAKSKARKEREKLFLENFPQTQIDRAVDKVVNGNGTETDLSFIMRKVMPEAELMIQQTRITISFVRASTSAKERK